MLSNDAMRYLTIGICLLALPVSALATSPELREEPFHAVDASVLLPNANPSLLPSIHEFLPKDNGKSFRDALKAMLGENPQTRANADIVRRRVGPFDNLGAGCVTDETKWKLVAFRLNPFASPLPGLTGKYDAQKIKHQRVASVHLTFQPFCYVDDAYKNVAGDAAILLMFHPGKKAHVQHFTKTHHAVMSALEEGKPVRAPWENLLGLLTEPEYQKPLAEIFELSVFLRNERLRKPVSVAGFETQAQSFQSLQGLAAKDSSGAPIGSLVHPLLRDLQGNTTWPLLLGRLKNLARPEQLTQVRMMTAAFGGLSWIFSQWNPQEKKQLPISVVTTNPMPDSAPDSAQRLEQGAARRSMGGPTTGLPEMVTNIGYYDFRHISELGRPLGDSERHYYSQYAHLEQVDENTELALKALEKQMLLDDPARTSHSSQTCFDCHASQERTTAAKQALAGRAPREFGYFFRAFGYFNNQPFVNRRFLNEANSVTQALNNYELKGQLP